MFNDQDLPDPVCIEFKPQPEEPTLEPSSPPENVIMKMCTVPGEDGNPVEIPYHACFEAEDDKPIKDYYGRFCAMVQCSPCGFAASKWNPIYERSYQRKTYNPMLEPCIQSQKCPEDKPKVPDPEPVLPLITKDYQNLTKRRTCNEFCCRPLLASRLNLTCTQSPTRGCISPQAYTFSASSLSCPSPCSSKYPKLPNKPITILVQCCQPKRKEFQ